MVEIVEVKTKRQLKQFVKFVNKLYWDCEYYVPMINVDEINNFIPKKNPAFEECDVKLFLAYRDGKIVGRIAGIIQHAYNKKMNCKKVRFTRFDCIDDQEVANALFDAVKDWAKAQGMTHIMGPLGFNDLDREGMLVEGFDRLATYETQYNYDYYPKLVENYGFQVDVTWVEYRIKIPEALDEKYNRIGAKILERYNLTTVGKISKKQLFKQYGDKIFDLLDEGYKDLYGTVPYSKKIRQLILKNFGPALKPELMSIILNAEGNPVAYALILPSLAVAVRDSHGKLLPLGACRMLHAINHPKVVDFALVVVDKEYHNKGLNSIIFTQIVEMFKKMGVQECETNLNLEDNYAIQNMWHNFEREQHKKRHSYIKEID